jgi:hypothetical protein
VGGQVVGTDSGQDPTEAPHWCAAGVDEVDVHHGSNLPI